MSVASGGGTLQSGTEKIPAPSCTDTGGSEGVFNRESRGAESKEMGLPEADEGKRLLTCCA